MKKNIMLIIALCITYGALNAGMLAQDPDWQAAHAQRPLTPSEREGVLGASGGAKRREGLGGDQYHLVGEKSGEGLLGLQHPTTLNNKLRNSIRIKGALGLSKTVPALKDITLHTRISDLFEIEIMSNEKSGLVLNKLRFDLREIIRHIDWIHSVTLNEDNTLNISGDLKAGGKIRDRNYLIWALNSFRKDDPQRWQQSRFLRGLHKYLADEIRADKMGAMIERGAFLALYCNYGTPEQPGRAPYPANCDFVRPALELGSQVGLNLERRVRVSHIRPIVRAKMMSTPPAGPKG